MSKNGVIRFGSAKKQGVSLNKGSDVLQISGRGYSNK